MRNEIEYESKFFDQEYVKIRLNEIPDIRNGGVTYTFHNSDRSGSNSYYIRFFRFNSKSVCVQLRISDHMTKTPNNDVNFCVHKDRILTKKEKQIFFNTLKNCVETTKYKRLNFSLKKNSQILAQNVGNCKNKVYNNSEKQNSQ